MSWQETLGLVGVALVLSSYARLQWRREYAKEMSYSLLNLVGGALIVISLTHDWNLASFIGNSTFALISAYGVLRCWRYRRRAAKSREVGSPG